MPFLLRFFIILGCFFPVFAGAGGCELWLPAQGVAKGVVVVSHGLNLRPSRMDELAKELASAGYEVLRPAFAGHCGDEAAFLKVNAEDWERDARRIHGEASARAAAKKVPLHLVAYSFSALVFDALSGETPFVKRVYLAPPLARKFWYPVVAFFARLFPDFSYPSMNLPEYLANKRSGARAVLALDSFVRRWERGGAARRANVLLIAEPGDELVSFTGLQALAGENSGWRLEALSNRRASLPKTYHHLIVDSLALGAEEFRRMSGIILAFLGN